MSQGSNKTEPVSIWRFTTGLGAMDLMSAGYSRQRFARHSHRRFPLGVVQTGALGFKYRGESLVASAGDVNLANPGEPHDGHPAGEHGWSYRMFYLEPETFQKAANEISGHEISPPRFAAGVIRDLDLATCLNRLHHLMENPAQKALAVESMLLDCLARLISRYADSQPGRVLGSREPMAVTTAKDFLADNLNGNPSLGDLARITGLNPYHLAKTFQRATGLPPHEYLVNLRVNAARRLISQGTSIVDAALQAGFSDQSHLNRHFKRITGLTPGKFKRLMG